MREVGIEYFGYLDDRFTIGKTGRQHPIWFCPWCGTRLQPGLSNEWFNALEAIGLGDPWFEDRDKVPEEFKSDQWWVERGL